MVQSRSRIDYCTLMPDLPKPLHVFLSATTSDFGQQREDLLKNLSVPGQLTVFEQSRFLSSGGVLLETLDDCIKGCHAVFHLVGPSSGAFVSRAQVAWLLQTYPKFLDKFPFLTGALLEDPIKISYTQLEAWIAIYHEVKIYLFNANLENQNNSPDDSQTQHILWLKQRGRHLLPFNCDTELKNLVWKHIFNLPNRIRSDQTLKEIDDHNRRFSRETRKPLVNESMIPRTSSVDEAVTALLDPEKKGALIIAPAGYGKTCIISQIIERLESHSIPYLAISLDAADECKTAKQLGIQFDLSDSPAKLLAQRAEEKPCVLVIDQLDAMSVVSGRKIGLWQAFADLHEEAQSTPNMRLLLGCRDFDLIHDHRLIDLEKDEKRYAKVRVKELTHEEINNSLSSAGLSDTTPTPKQMDLLSIPLHLLLFLQGDPTKPFIQANDLFKTYWDRKQSLGLEMGIDEGTWNSVLFDIAKFMSANQLLLVPRARAALWEKTLKKLISINVLTESRGGYQFFHESFFDYTYARSFCLTGTGLVDFLRNDPQHLFRRSQVRQILSYRRDSDREQYLKDLSGMLSSGSIRFSLKRMVASELARVDSPNESEWKMVEPYLLEGDLSRYVSAALRGHVGWFDILDSTDTFRNWLVSIDEKHVNAAMCFFSDTTAHDHRSSRIAELLEPFLDSGLKWKDRLKSMFGWGKAHKSERMKFLYFRMVERGDFECDRDNVQGGGFWSSHYNSVEENPRFIIELLALWLRVVVTKYDDGEGGNPFDKSPVNNSHTGASMIREVAQTDPNYFVTTVLPVFAEIVKRTTKFFRDRVVNRVWQGINNSDYAHTIEDSVLIELRRSLETIARNEPGSFRVYFDSIRDDPDDATAYLLLNALAADPEEYCEECVDYLLERPNRLNLGYSGLFSPTMSDSMESAVARYAISKVTPYCSVNHLLKLEQAIMVSCDQYERETLGERGYGEYLLLMAIAPERLSQRARVRVDELRNNFPSRPVGIPQLNRGPLMSVTGPPIEPSKAVRMSDSHWISAMRKYDREHVFGKGGPWELSQVLVEETRRNRERFAALALRMSDDLASEYFNAILEGMSIQRQGLNEDQREKEQAKIDSLETQIFVKLIERVHKIPGKPCGRSIVDAVAQVAQRDLPNELLDIVCFYAKHDADPSNPIGDDPYTDGINSVRGRAALTISQLISEKSNRLDYLLPAIRGLVSDEALAVRTVAIEVCRVVLDIDPELALKLFLTATENEPAICGTSPFGRFVYCALAKHYDQIRVRLVEALASTNERCVEIAARNIVIAELSNVSNTQDCHAVRCGSVTMRRAAAGVYAHNLRDTMVGDRCQQGLRQFFQDESEEVRENVGLAFSELDGKRLLELQGFIIDFIDSKSFETSPEFLLWALEKSAQELPTVIVRAAERILDFLREPESSVTHRGALSTYPLSKLVVRQYSQTEDDDLRIRCMKIIDRMELLGFPGISEELARLER